MNIYLLSGTELGYLPVSLLPDDLPVKGVIGLSNTESNRSLNEYYDYESFCAKRNITYIPVNSYSLNDPSDRASLLSLDIDVLIVASWQRLIPEWLIKRCSIGAIGSHGSAEGISKGRGRSPQNWALMLGCDKFELSLFWIDSGIDSGNIIDSSVIRYSEIDDIFTSYIKIGLAMTDMLVKNYKNGSLLKNAGTPQNGDAYAYCPQRTASDGMIDWSRPARDIYNFIRAISKPYPGAFTILNHAKVTIWKAQYVSGSFKDGCAGKILICFPSGELLVKCGKDLLLITFMEHESGLRIESGMVFESASYKNQINEIIKRHLKKHSLPVSDMILKEAGSHMPHA